jgi:hypothetical protein
MNKNWQYQANRYGRRLRFKYMENGAQDPAEARIGVLTV